MVWLDTVFVFLLYQSTVYLLQSAAGRSAPCDPLLWIYRRFLGLGALGLWCWVCYLIKAPVLLQYATPLLVASLLLYRQTPAPPGTAQRYPVFFWVHGAVTLGLLSLLLTLQHFNGGGWAADWIEHYERTMFFVGQLPPDTHFLAQAYALPARPPLQNALSAFFVQPVGGSFIAFQVVALCLAAEIVWGVFAVLAAVRRTQTPLLCLAGFLCLASPVFVQNALFPWTKSLAAAFVLVALAALIRDQSHPGRRHLLFFGFFLAVAILTHYSAAVWLPGAALWLLYSDLFRQRRGFSATFQRLWPGALAGALVLLLWLGWSFGQFGISATLGATTTIADSALRTPGENLIKIALNIRDTIVPYFWRELDPVTLHVAFAPHPLPRLRDFLFNLSQLNLLFFGGLSLPMVWLGLLLSRKYRPPPPLLIAFSLIGGPAFILGIAVHGDPNSLGLMHICLQPMLYLALVSLVCLSPRLPPALLILLLIASGLSLLIETGLHSRLMGFALTDWLLLLPPDHSSQDLLPLLGPNIFNNLASHFLLGFPTAGARSGLPWLTGYFLYLSAAGALLLPWLQARFSLFWDRPSPPAPPPVPAIHHGRKAGKVAPARPPGQARVIASRGLGIVLIVAAVSILGQAALNLSFKTFRLYDDEGYILFSLVNFGRGMALYETIFSQYGPAFFLIADGLAKLLGFGWTNDHARLWNLVLWISTAAGCGWLCLSITRNNVAALFTTTATFLILVINLLEPSHPGSFIALAVMAGALLGTTAALSSRWMLFASGTALAGVVLGLSKINVGAFFVLAVFFWLLAAAKPGEIRFSRLLGLFIPAALPFFVVSSHLDEASFVALATIASLGLLTTLRAVSFHGHPGPPPGTLLHFLATGLLGTALVSALIVLRGTPPLALLDGVVLAPLQHPGVYSFGFPIGVLSFVFPILILAYSLFLAFQAPTGRTRPAVIVLRWAAVLVLVAYAILPLPVDKNTWLLCILLPLLAASAIRLEKTPSRAEIACGLLCSVLFLQILHAYPVAGSQIGWGSFLAPLIALIGFCDTLRLKQHPAILWALFCLFLATSLWTAGRFVHTARVDPPDWVHLNLPGAQQVRVPLSTGLSLQFIQASATQADQVMTLPGMFSFNLWSGRPTPTGQNATHWFNLLSARHQQEIIEALQEASRPLLIVNEGLIHFLLRQGIPVQGPLVSYLFENFERRATLPTHSLWLPRDSSAQLPGIIQESGDAHQVRLQLPGERITALRAFILRDGTVLADPSLLDKVAIHRLDGPRPAQIFPPPPGQELDFGPPGETTLRLTGLPPVNGSLFIQMVDQNGRTRSVLLMPPLPNPP